MLKFQKTYEIQQIVEVKKHRIFYFGLNYSQKIEGLKNSNPMGFSLVIVDSYTHRINQMTLPLRNAPKKWILFSIAMVGSSKKSRSSFSKNVWTFEI